MVGVAVRVYTGVRQRDGRRSRHAAHERDRVQACGDATLMNFGGFATPERNVIFDITDLDETLPARSSGT